MRLTAPLPFRECASISSSYQSLFALVNYCLFTDVTVSSLSVCSLFFFKFFVFSINKFLSCCDVVIFLYSQISCLCSAVNEPLLAA